MGAESGKAHAREKALGQRKWPSTMRQKRSQGKASSRSRGTASSWMVPEGQWQGEGTKQVSAEGGGTDLACCGGRTVPRVAGMLPTHLCEAPLVNGAWLTGQRPHQTCPWVLFCADSGAPHQPVQMGTSRREELRYCSGWGPRALGSWVRLRRKLLPHRIRAQEELRGHCLMQPGSSPPRWLPLCSKDGRRPRGHVHRQQGKHTNDHKPLCGSLCP